MNNPEIELRKKKWIQYYKNQPSKENPFLFIIRMTDPNDPMPDLWPSKKEERIAWIKRDYHRQLEQLYWLADDKVPFLDLITGTEIFAEAFGSEIHRAEDQKPFALPLINSLEEVDKIRKPALLESSLALQFEIADRVYNDIKEEVGFAPTLRMVDIQTPMDIAALLWAKEDFFPSMITNPDIVKSVAHKIQELQFEFFDKWFSDYGSSFVAHFPEYYMDNGISMSEDEIGTVSPAMFDQFFLPELNDFSRRYGGIGIHCCADSRHQWDGFRKVENLKLMNLGRPSCIMEEAYGYFGDSVIVLPNNNGEGDSNAWPEKEGKTVFYFNLTDRDEAQKIADKLNSLKQKK